jgi:hypothetical protein
MKRRIVAIALALVLIVALSACGSDTNAIKTLVQGNIDTIYLGQYDQDYMELTGETEETLNQQYEDGLDVEAQYFCSYFSIVDSSAGETYDDVSDDIKQQIIDMYKEIYSHAKFTVGEVAAMQDGNYTVQVTVSPINIIRLAMEAVESGGSNPYNDFTTETASLDFASMTTEQYAEYCKNYAQACIDLVKSQMSNIGYEEDKTQSLQVQKDSDGLYSINADDWAVFDTYVIYYP